MARFVTILCVMLGLAVVGSVSYGGWRIWSAGDAVNENVPQTNVPVTPPVVQTPVVLDDVVVAATKAPVVETPVVAEPDVKKDETARKKELPKGKLHDRQEMLLALMAQQLHQDAYTRFIRQPGMGMSRMMPTLTVVKREWKTPDWTSEELSREQPPLKGLKDMTLIHRGSLNMFVESNTKTEQERVAAYSKNPPAKKDFIWEIKSLDLVGLVMNETPTVYISDKLPLMEKLAERPTREMDVFESEGLEELMTGKPLYVRAKGDTIRVLGPIQASKACLKCHHDAKEGDMLGAFSYTLREGQYQMFGRGFQPDPAVAPKLVPKK